MNRYALLGLASFALVSSGCFGAGDLPGKPKDVVWNLLAGEPLWDDPQDTPHPLYNWPTLSHPANGTTLPEYWAPIDGVDLPSVIQGLTHLSSVPDIKRGGGIALFGSLAVVPGYSDDTHVVDISDPARPVSLSKFRPQDALKPENPQATPPWHRGATIIAYPDGRLATVISTQYGLDVWNITDPRQPVEASVIKIASHKVGVVPGTPIVYNAASGGGGAIDPSQSEKQAGGRTVETARGFTGIYDLTNPEEPRFVKNWTNGFSCHHVYFWNKPAENKFRGLCAGVQYTQIWDTTDPFDPKVIVNVPVHHGKAGSPSGSTYGLVPPGVVPPNALTPQVFGIVNPSTTAFSHYAGLSNDGKTLVVGDEQGGGGSQPGCVAMVDTPQGAVSTPVGALWFYDVSNEKDPKVLGWFSALNDPRVKAGPTTSCTAHHGRMVPVPGRDVIAMSFYGSGVVVVDFTGIGKPNSALPHVLGQFADRSNTWETWYYHGFLFTGDLNRGMDVIKFV